MTIRLKKDLELHLNIPKQSFTAVKQALIWSALNKRGTYIFKCLRKRLNTYSVEMSTSLTILRTFSRRSLFTKTRILLII